MYQNGTSDLPKLVSLTKLAIHISTCQKFSIFQLLVSAENYVMTTKTCVERHFGIS